MYPWEGQICLLLYSDTSIESEDNIPPKTLSLSELSYTQKGFIQDNDTTETRDNYCLVTRN